MNELSQLLSSATLDAYFLRNVEQLIKLEQSLPQLIDTNPSDQ